MELGVGREARIDSRTTKEIQGDERLGQKAVPKMKRKVFVSAAETGDEMVLERADGTFSGIAAVDIAGGTSWKSIPSAVMNCWSVVEASLSSFWSCGRRPR